MALLPRRTSLDGSVNVGLGFSNLVLVLLLELAKLGALEVGLDGKPELEPEPGLGHHVGTDGALASVQGHLLVLQLLELHPGGLATGTGLQPGKDRSNLVLALLLHPATNAGPEEDEGVAQPELLLVQLDDVHHSLSGGLVVLGLGNGSGSNDVVPSLELRIGQLVWGSQHGRWRFRRAHRCTGTGASPSRAQRLRGCSGGVSCRGWSSGRRAGP